jgi:hypothetical protein
LGEVLKTDLKTALVTKLIHLPRSWAEPLVQPKQQIRYLTFSTWNIRSLYRSNSFTIVYRESAKYKLDLVGVEEVRWDKEAR